MATPSEKMLEISIAQESLLRERIPPLKRALEQHQISSETSKKLTEAETVEWEEDPQYEAQTGWNCFDIAVGIKDRKELVAYALENNTPIFRGLLAPEIRYAAAITQVYMELEKSYAEKEKQEVEKAVSNRMQRIQKLFDMADALKDRRDRVLVNNQIAKILSETKSKNNNADLNDLLRNALPIKMHTEEVYQLVTAYDEAHQSIKKAMAECNDRLGYPEGKRLNLEELDKFFSDAENKKNHQEVYESFFKVRKEYLEPAIIALQEYCARSDTYKKYIEEYYSQNQWVAFQRVGSTHNGTSMVDIAARMLQTRIIIHQEEQDKTIYETTNHEHKNEPLHIRYRGNNHFVRLRRKKIELDNKEPKEKHNEISTHTTSTQSKVKSDSEEKNASDKQEDLKTITAIIEVINVLISIDFNSRDFVALSKIVKENIAKISKLCNAIRRNYESPTNIRNRYGRCNYSKGKLNPIYIDWEELASIERIFEYSVYQKQFLSITLGHVEEFKRDLDVLKMQLSFILKKENNVQEANSISKKSSGDGGLENPHMLSAFPILIRFYLDFICLEHIINASNPQLYQTLNHVMENSPLGRKERYIIGRLITIMGEASKNLSPMVINALPIPFKDLAKLRDKMGHKMVRYHKDSVECYQILVTVDLPRMYQICGRQQNISIGMLEGFDSGTFWDKIKKMWDAAVKKDTKDDNKQILEKLQTEMYKLSAERNRLIQLEENRHKTKNEPKAVEQSKEQRILSKIKSLEEKQKTASLSKNEKKALAETKKSLDKLRKGNTNKSIQEPILWHSTQMDLKKIEEGLDKKHKELENAKGFQGIIGLSRRISEKPLKRKSDRPPLSEREKINRKIKKIIEEINFLKLILEGRSKSQRDYAMEHSQSIIGQLIRDIGKYKDDLIGSLLNPTVKESLGSTLKTRDQKIMHEPFRDHTANLMTLTVNTILPMTRDIEAIQIISESDINDVSKLVAEKLAEVYNNIGFAYNRLCQFEYAEEYFKEALQALSPEFFARSIGIDLENTTLVVVQPCDYRETIQSYKQSAEGKLLTEEAIRDLLINTERIFNEIIIMDNLSSALLAQKRYAEARPHLEKIFDYIVELRLYDRAEFSWHYITNFITVLYKLRDPAANACYNQIRQRLLNSEEYYILVLNLANILGEQNLNNEARNFLDSIDFKKLNDEYFQIMYLLSQGKLYAYCGMEQENVNELRASMKCFQEASKILSENLGRLREKCGDKIRILQEDFNTAYRKTVANFSAFLSNVGLKLSEELCLASIRKSLEYFNEALKLQSDFNLNCNTTYNNMGRSYYALMRLEPDNKRNHAKTAIENYTHNLGCEDLNSCIQANMCIGFIYEEIEQFATAIRYLLIARKLLQEYNVSENSKENKEKAQDINQTEKALVECVQRAGLTKIINYTESLAKKHHEENIILIKILLKIKELDPLCRVTLYSRLGSAYEALRQYKEAMACFQHCLTAGTKSLGENHEYTKVILHKMEQCKKLSEALRKDKETKAQAQHDLTAKRFA